MIRLWLSPSTSAARATPICPASAVESARRDILDTFGCMLGGSGSPAIGELFAVVSRADWPKAACCCAA